MAAARRKIEAQQNPPAPEAPPAIDPNALPTAITRPAKNITRGLKNSARAQAVFNIATRKAEGTAQAEGLAADSPAINEQGGLSQLSNPEFTKRGSQLLSAANVMRKLTAQPKEDASDVSDAPASPAISALMQKLQGQAAPTANAAPVGPEPSTPQGGLPPQAPMIAKISKKLNGSVNETPHPEAEQPYTPLTPEELWGKGLGDKEFAAADAAQKTDLKYPDRYQQGIIRDRKLRRNALGAEVGDDVGPNSAHAEDLLQELHHISRADKAHRAVLHFTSKMSPAMRDALRARLNKGFINSIWSQ
jgi:hypothetical protein